MRRWKDGENQHGAERSRNIADAMIPAGDEDHTPKEERDRWFHMNRLKDAPSNEDLLLEARQRMRERLLQIELYAGANASYEEKAGEYEVADIHRRYASYCKAVRLNQPLPTSLGKKGSK